MRTVRQKIICPPDVIPGHLITKDKRQQLFGHVAGGSGSMKPEIFQRTSIIEGTGIECKKTCMRINLRTHALENIRNPNILKQGFDYSEDFDGFQTYKNASIYINMKCVVGKGGAQTRTLREVYWFIKGQLQTLLKTPDVYFANILDGDEAFSCLSKFQYLVSCNKFDPVRSRIYVGDLKGYFDWFSETFLVEEHEEKYGMQVQTGSSYEHIPLTPCTVGEKGSTLFDVSCLKSH